MIMEHWKRLSGLSIICGITNTNFRDREEDYPLVLEQRLGHNPF